MIRSAAERFDSVEKKAARIGRPLRFGPFDPLGLIQTLPLRLVLVGSTTTTTTTTTTKKKKTKKKSAALHRLLLGCDSMAGQRIRQARARRVPSSAASKRNWLPQKRTGGRTRRRSMVEEERPLSRPPR